MFTKRPLITHSKLLQRFFKPTLDREAYFAYIHRLPKNVEVSWRRDDGMIIGKVNAGGKEFMTQGTDARDFIQMVNESIATIYHIPEDYIDAVIQAKTYAPSASERNMLEDQAVMSHSFGLIKDTHALKAA